MPLLPRSRRSQLGLEPLLTCLRLLGSSGPPAVILRVLHQPSGLLSAPFHPRQTQPLLPRC